MQIRLMAIVTLLLWTVGSVWAASPKAMQMEVEDNHVANWNRFALNIYNLHLKQISGKETRQTVTSGEYGGLAAEGIFYKETSYHDANTGLLLSRIRADRDKPEIRHSVEAFIYDGQGRLARDYAALYLPWSQNAPMNTVINLHSYKQGLHAYRQFNATGDLIYEQCKGTAAGSKVDISLEGYQIRPPITETGAYQACFAGAAITAGVYLIPQ